MLGALAARWGGHRDYARGLALAEDAVGAAEASGDRRAIAEALGQSALMLLNVGRIRECHAHLHRVLAIFEEMGDAPGVADTLDVLTLAEGIRGHASAGVRHGEDALRSIGASAIAPRRRGWRPPSACGTCMPATGRAARPS